MRPDRDWIDIGTVIVLALAFFAAAYAAKEGERLSNATIDATARADFAARAQHLDTLAALKRADDANAIAKATADRQAQDTASALALSKKAVDAAQQSARLVRDNFIIDRRPYVWLTNDLGAPELKRLPNGSLQVIWPWYFTNYGKSASSHTKTVHFISINGETFQPSFGSGDQTQSGVPIPPNVTLRREVVSQPITDERWAKALTTDLGISISGIIDYEDDAGNRYRSTFCVGRLATGAIAYREPSENCNNEVK